MNSAQGLDFDIDTRKLYVCDYMNQRCCTFNEQGQYFGEFHVGRTQAADYNDIGSTESILNKFYPYRVKLSRDHLFVSDDWMGGNCIRVFDKFKHTHVHNIVGGCCHP